MSSFLTNFVWMILGLSLLVMLVEFFLGRRDRRLILLFVVTFLFLGIAIKYLHFPQRIEYKGEVAEIGLVICLYGAVLAGMAAQYFFDKIDHTTPFNIWTFIKPFLISPMIFLPVLEIIRMTDLTGEKKTLSLIMLFFIAFQNGFCWRYVFEEQKKKIGVGK